MKSLKTAFILLLLVFPILSSCHKNSFGTTPEQKIVGTWLFEKVKFKPKGNISYTDFTDAYVNCTVTFNDDWTLTAYDAKSDITAYGSWYIDWYTNYDEDDVTESTVYVLIGTMDNTSLGIINDVYWDELVVSNKKLTAIEEKDSGKYKYTMTRVD
tara:strand:- start:1940 stop:2407 length:468 start_codon:yes stop_codon:yes gene_type:complete